MDDVVELKLVQGEGNAEGEDAVAAVHASVGAIGLTGLSAQPVNVECMVGGGLPGFRVTGMPDSSIREASDRVRGAIERTEDIKWRNIKTVVNLAPAALRKHGAGFDLPMALAILAATNQLDIGRLDGLYAFGELGLDGSLRVVPGTLPIARGARAAGAKRLLVPARAGAEAALVEGLDVIVASSLSEAVSILKGHRASDLPQPPRQRSTSNTGPCMSEVRGQPVARRALEIAAVGGHHVLLAGPPGCGKSMLARRLPSILPQLSLDDALSTAAIHSVAGLRAPDAPLDRTAPFREPHHTTSVAGLIGGGAGIPRPGEVSLAHNGVLFMDELLETPRHVLDAMRQPLESGHITVVRAAGVVRYPARVQLVAATNPCPCGYLGSGKRPCRCRPDQIERYRGRLSGPLLDRIDVQVELRPVEHGLLAGPPDGERSASIAERVGAARAFGRQCGRPLNRCASVQQLREVTETAALEALSRAVDGMGLSARGFDSALRVARSIADLEQSRHTQTHHIDEAVAYRLATSASAV